MDKLKAIAIFIEIADHGSMSAAARSIGVVNSVITKNLNELEAWLGKTLVYRSTRNLRLTQDGMNYLSECRLIMNQVTRLENRSKLDDEIVQGQVNVTAPLYLGQSLVTPLIAEFNHRFPLIRLNLILSDDFENMIEMGYDLALRASQMPDSSYICRRLKKVRLKLVASPAYVQQHALPTSPKALRNHQCIIEGVSSDRRRWLFKNKNGRQTSISVSGDMRTNYGGMVKAICIEGLGIAQLPDFMVEQEIKAGKLVEILPQYDLDNFYIHLLYHRESSANKAVKTVVDYLVKKVRA